MSKTRYGLHTLTLSSAQADGFSIVRYRARDEGEVTKELNADGPAPKRRRESKETSSPTIASLDDDGQAAGEK